MRIYKLKFLSALHVDSRGSGQLENAEEFICSDTLSAALCISHSALHPEVRQEMFKHPPFTVSSAFPYIGDTLLFPIPQWRIWTNMDPHQRKKLKSVKWLSQSLFELILSGQQAAYDEIHILQNGIAVLQKDIQMNSDLKRTQTWKMSERQRVNVDRLGIPKDEGLFFFALQFFAPTAGLWFFADAASSDHRQFRSSLDFLGDSGIGSDRNSGLGHFKVVHDDPFNINVSETSDGWITLSLFNPDPSEKLDRLILKTAYGLTTRSGWISHSTLGRPPVRVFTEGSFFSAKPQGRMTTMSINETVQKEAGLHHEVFRDFRAMSLPCAEPFHLKGNANE